MSNRMSSEGQSPPEVESLAPRHYLTLLTSWVIPGSGHFLVGRRRRAIAFFVLILSSLLIGWLLDGNLHRVIPNQPLTVLATLGSMGMGSPYFILRYLVGYEGDVVSAGYEYGSAFILTAGLMNLLLILDVWDILRGRKR